MGGSHSGGDRVANGIDTFPRDGLPSRPSCFDRGENEYWTLLMRQIPNELLRRVDAHQLRTLCECLALRDKLLPVLKEAATIPNLSSYLRVVQQIQRLSPLFGLAPLDRRRMKIGAVEESDAASDWENEG